MLFANSSCRRFDFDRFELVAVESARDEEIGYEHARHGSIRAIGQAANERIGVAAIDGRCAIAPRRRQCVERREGQEGRSLDAQLAERQSELAAFDHAEDAFAVEFVERHKKAGRHEEKLVGRENADAAETFADEVGHG